MNVLKLVVKDIRAHLLYLLLSTLLVLLISTLFIYLFLYQDGQADPELVIYCLVLLLSSSIASLLFLAMDESYKTDEIFASLPLSRMQIVAAKYAASFLLLFWAFVMHFLGIQMGIFLYGGSMNAELTLIYNPQLWLLLGAMLVVFKGYSYPLYFKFGLGAGVIIHCVIQFLLLVVLIVSLQYFNPNLWLGNIIKWCADQNAILLLLGILLALTVLIGLSIKLSTYFFKHKAL